MESKNIAYVRITRIFFSHALRIGKHGADFMLQIFTAIADVNGVVVGFAHLSAVGAHSFEHSLKSVPKIYFP